MTFKKSISYTFQKRIFQYDDSYFLQIQIPFLKNIQSYDYQIIGTKGYQFNSSNTINMNYGPKDKIEPHYISVVVTTIQQLFFQIIIKINDENETEHSLFEFIELKDLVHDISNMSREPIKKNIIMTIKASEENIKEESESESESEEEDEDVKEEICDNNNI